MSINLMFANANNNIKNGNIINALHILKDIWVKYPQNFKLFDEIKKVRKKNTPLLRSSLNQEKINDLFSLHKEGKTTAVIKNLEFLNNEDPNDFYVLNLLGIFNGLLENYKEAIQYQKLSININPFDPNNYQNLSSSLEKEGELNSALSILEIGKILDYNNLSINKQLARLYVKLYNYSSANFIYKELILLDKNNYQIKLDFIASLINGVKIEEALQYIRITKFEKHFEDKILTLQGLAYFKLNKFNEAQDFINSALIINKDNSDSHTILGLIYESLGFINKALKSHAKAIKSNNRNYVAFNNLAACYSFVGDIDLSISNFKEAIKINPNFFDGIYRLGQMQIYNGDFVNGWINFRERWKSSDYVHKKLITSKPLLNKIESKNIKILAWNEQGLGDQVMYGSMFNEFSKLTSNLIVKLDKRLINVFEKNHPKIKFVGIDDFVSEDQYDKHIPFGDMGIHLRNTKDAFLKTDFPYISGSEKTKNLIIQKYKKKDFLLVGISWSSSNHLLSEHKSLSLERLYPILKIKNIKFISLDYKNDREEIRQFKAKYDIEIFKDDNIDNFKDIKGLCSIIEACDFVISCSNTNAHLSGALNKKTFLLLAKGKGRLWNWNSNNGYSLWYPQTMIIQQKIVGDWQQPITALKEEIKKNESQIN